MGQQANSGRNASLDNKKLRAAGRQEQNPQLNQARDPNWDTPAKGKTGGAFGKVAKDKPSGDATPATGWHKRT